MARKSLRKFQNGDTVTIGLGKYKRNATVLNYKRVYEVSHYLVNIGGVVVRWAPEDQLKPLMCKKSHPL